MSEKNNAPEGVDDTPYVGADDAFPDMDDMTEEEQALYQAEMAGELASDADDEGGEDPAPAAAQDDEDGPDADRGDSGESEDDAAATGEDDEAELDAANRGEDDGEGEAESDGDPEAEGEEPEQQRTQRDEPRIPKARFDQERRRRQELERRIQELETQGRVEEAEAAELALDFNDVIDQDAITRALDMNLDGKNTEAAQALIAEITKAVQYGATAGRDQMRAEFNTRLEAGVNEAANRVSRQSLAERYDSTVDQIENDYPVFNPESDQYDDALMDSAATLMKAFQAEGKDAVDALNEAIEVTLMRNKPELLKSRKTPSEDTPPAQQRQAADTRARRQRETNARTAGQQPSRQSGRPATASDNNINLENLSEEEFDALPESTKAEMRGDAL